MLTNQSIHRAERWLSGGQTNTDKQTNKRRGGSFVVFVYALRCIYILVLLLVCLCLCVAMAFVRVCVSDCVFAFVFAINATTVNWSLSLKTQQH